MNDCSAAAEAQKMLKGKITLNCPIVLEAAFTTCFTKAVEFKVYFSVS